MAGPVKQMDYWEWVLDTSGPSVLFCRSESTSSGKGYRESSGNLMKGYKGFYYQKLTWLKENDRFIDFKIH